MLQIRLKTEYIQDVGRLKREGWDLEELNAVVSVLQMVDEEPLSPAFIHAHSVHTLHGEWAEHDELHIDGDWLLVYKAGNNVLKLVRTGTHKDIFRAWRNK